MKVLGIETSCDETAMAIVDDKKNVYAHTLASHIAAHQPFGGVVPELASRNHLDCISDIYAQTISDAKIHTNEIDAIAVTAGPGLIGGLLVGVMFAKGLAMALNKPIIAVNHLEGHALTPRISHELDFPYLMLLVSGGHCQILEVFNVNQYKIIGKTRDDSVGEAFDKISRMLGLSYPGGPIIEKLALRGNPKSITFPTALLTDSICDFSFSGLKSAVKRYIESITLNDEIIANICASFQEAVSITLCDRMYNAVNTLSKNHNYYKNIIIAGGVSANQYIKTKIQNYFTGYNIITAPISLCTDNGIMIAWAGLERFKRGLIDNLDFEPLSRWPLESLGKSL